MEKHERFIDALNYRRSIRFYDDAKEIEDEVVKKCIQQATLAPNSSNMQLWEFHHVTSKDLMKKLSVACLGQPAATTAKQMVVVVVRKDLWKQRAKSNPQYSKYLCKEPEGKTKYQRKICPQLLRQTDAFCIWRVPRLVWLLQISHFVGNRNFQANLSPAATIGYAHCGP